MGKVFVNKAIGNSHMHSPFLSRTENVLHAFLLLAFAFLSFYKNAIRRIRLQIGFANLPLWPLTSFLSFMHRVENPTGFLATYKFSASITPRIPKGCASSKQSLRPFHSPSYPAIISFCLFQGIGAVDVGAFCAFFEPEYEAYYEEEQAA